MAEVVAVEATKPRVNYVTVKLTAGDARDVLTFVEAYYQRAGWMGSPSQNSTHRAIKDALDGVKPKIDGINLANGKVKIA